MRPHQILGWTARELKKLLTPKALILMYHSVAEVRSDPWSLCVTPRHFAEQLEVLHKKARPMSLRELVQRLWNGEIPRRAVVVTFDDGYANNLYSAKPLLERYDTPATVFLTSRYIGYEGEFWWDELDRLLLQPGALPEALCLRIDGSTYRWELGTAVNYSEADYRSSHTLSPAKGRHGSRHALYYSIWQLLQPRQEGERRKALDQIRAWARAESAARPTHRPLSLEEICALGQGGLIEIGSHTMTHPLLSVHSLAFQRDEIQHSKAHLEEIVGHPVASFAYPYGDYAAETIAAVREAGFACACSTVAESVWRYSDQFQLPRFEVRDWNGEEFMKRLRWWFVR